MGRTRGPRPRYTHRIQPISAGMGEVYPVVLFPATGPSHCAAPAYALHLAGRRQESLLLCGNLVFGPPYLTPRPCVLHARRTSSLAAVFPAHGASWAGLAVVKEGNTNSTRAAHRRALSVKMACTSIGHRGRTSARLAGALSGSALAAPPPFVVRSRPTADGRRETADFCRWPYICSVGCVPTPARLCRVLLAFIFELPVWRCRRHRRV